MTEFRYEEIKQSARQVLTELGLPKRTQTRCFSILDDKRTKEILTERNADGIIAGAIYIAAILTKNRITQQSLADVMDVSKATIRKYYAMLAKMVEIRRREH
jgi:transcription initiation factor TFIIIB Brf1 subunit/transcription initiation factor TFIIB